MRSMTSLPAPLLSERRDFVVNSEYVGGIRSVEMRRFCLQIFLRLQFKPFRVSPLCRFLFLLIIKDIANTLNVCRARLFVIFVLPLANPTDSEATRCKADGLPAALQDSLIELEISLVSSRGSEDLEKTVSTYVSNCSGTHHVHVIQRSNSLRTSSRSSFASSFLV